MFNIPKDLIPNPSNSQRIKRVRLTIDEIKQLPDTELLELLSGESPTGGVISAPLLQAISYELTSRQIQKSAKPNWIAYAGLALAFVAAIASVIALLK